MISPLHREVFADLIGIDTVNPPGNELVAAEYIRSFLETSGFRVELQDMGGNRGNIIAELGDEKLGPTVMLTGHLDVVAVEKDWTHNPFLLREEHEVFYGRGTADMKGAISCMMMAARRFAKQHEQIKGKLKLVFVADEEIHGRGSKKALETGPYPDYAIIGEPTRMDVHVAHRGVSRYTMTFAGKGGHASRPEDARNPVYPMAIFISAVAELNEQLKQKKYSILPPPTAAVTMVEGGKQGNTIPNVCKVTVDRRTIPGETKALVEKEIRALMDKIPKSMRNINVEIDYFVHTPATAPNPDGVAAKLSREVLASLGHAAQIRDFPAGCDQFLFMEKGIDCILVGPGNIEQAHVTNEFVTSEQLELAEKFYYGFMEKVLL